MTFARFGQKKMYCRGPVAATIGVLFLLFHYIEVVKGVLPPYVPLLQGNTEHAPHILYI